MHRNAQTIDRLYTSLNCHDGLTMAECYHRAAKYHDIAFDLRTKNEIVAMWEMICKTTDIRTTFEISSANELTGAAKVVDEYTFSQTGRRVRNVIQARLRFEDGLIVEHIELSDPHLWAAMAIGGIGGFLAGRIRLLRTWKANRLLKDFLSKAGSENLLTGELR